MDIERFMQGYKAAWEQRDPAMFAALFRPDGSYHNTPFQVQRGTAQLAEYWKRVQLQETSGSRSRFWPAPRAPASRTGTSATGSLPRSCSRSGGRVHRHQSDRPQAG